MLAFQNRFPGPVDIIAGVSGPESVQGSVFARVDDADILALLDRRPCTLTDVANGLGLHVQEAVKRLEAMISVGKVKTAAASRRRFYTTARTGENSAFSAEADER